jgi:cytochrome c peroxidase
VPHVRAGCLVLLVLVFLVPACADPGTAPASGGTATGVADVLKLDLANPPNYASPSWPAEYDAGVLGRDNETSGNPVTDRGALLGRVLFYDRRLSINNTIACATCHRQALGFTDPARFSVGFDGVRRTRAHAMRLLNARFYSSGEAFWDRRAGSLEQQATAPIRDSVEMGFDPGHGGLDSLFARMRALDYYPELFAYAFGDSLITEDRIQRAIAQFVRSIVSVDSRWDRAYAPVYDPLAPDRAVSAPFPGFTAQENRGKQLFLLAPVSGGAGCGACHVPPTFALVSNSLSNGLDAGETRLFKAPSLKSIARTGPYMHDGRLATLAQVVQHYIDGVQEGPALDNRLRAPNGTPQRLPLTAADKAALVAFLRTLTDNSMAIDPRFADPFRR